MKKFKTAIIGVGKGGKGKAGIHSIGYAHANAYQNNPRTELVGACDLNAENLQAFSTTYPISAAHTSLSEVLSAARPDIVSICTYASSHRALVEQCLAAGVKAIWCEKPLCLAMDDGRATEGTLDLRWDSRLMLLNPNGLREVSTKSSLHGPRPEYPEEDGWQLLLNDFLRWLDGGPEPQVCLRNALASTELYLAAYESAKIGNRIDLPLAFQDKFPLDEIAFRQTLN